MAAPNASCSSNDDCENGACGRFGAGGKLVCCPSGNYELYGGYDYCTNLPVGTSCWSDAMCASNMCWSTHQSRAYTGTCIAANSLPNGQVCWSNNQCASSICTQKGSVPTCQPGAAPPPPSPPPPPPPPPPVPVPLAPQPSSDTKGFIIIGVIVGVLLLLFLLIFLLRR
jgi:hypothetical protein